jgi:cellulose synthase/poly-beta-1,6-N-acetylglucosamine synthase-like glycosyltransferase
MSGHETPVISVLVPARNEELTLPSTLPGILEATRGLPHPAEVVVIVPPDSPVLVEPPIQDTLLRWIPTPRPGKFNALRTGADAARGDVLLLVDADVLIQPDAFRVLAEPMIAGTADVVAGRIDLLPFATSGIEQLFERWAVLSFQAWHELRSRHPDLRWALPGAIYGVRRAFFPAEPLVAIVDDVSLGLYAKDAGAVFAYVPEAVVLTAAPPTWQGWIRQKLRSRRGWAALGRIRPTDVTQLESTIRRYLASTAQDDPTAPLMFAQDRALRFLARQSLRWQREPSGTWNPTRGTQQWKELSGASGIEPANVPPVPAE